MNEICRLAFDERLQRVYERVAALHEGTILHDGMALHGETAALSQTADCALLTRSQRDLDEAVDFLSEALDLLGRRQASDERLAAHHAREHRIAEAFQRTLLPDVSIPRFPGLAVAAAYAAASEEARVGGDFYDVLPLEGGRVALAVGDVSGKGLVPAMRAAEIKTALRAFLRDDPCTATALSRLNKFICDYRRLDHQPEELFVTLALAIVQADTGNLSFAVAGAEPPLLVRAGGSMEAVTSSLLLLGVEPDARYWPADLRLGPGDRVLLVTDGITEARNGPYFLEYIGLVGLAERSKTQKTLQGMVESVLNGARDFAGGRLADDACVLIAQRL